MNLINKRKLRGKHITFIDKDGKMRSEKVVRITGNTLTVKNKVNRKMRIHPDKNKILGRQLKNKIQEIEWK